MKKVIGNYDLGDMTVSYIEDTESGNCGMLLYPLGMREKVTYRGDWRVDSLVQVKIVGDAYPTGFSHGHTMRNAQTAEDLRFVSQVRECGEGSAYIIKTILESKKLRAVHRLLYCEGMPYVRMDTEIENIGGQPVSLEMLSSFSVCGLFPFGEEERMEDFNLYRLRSKWSAEGKLAKESFTSLQMEPSWQRYGVQSVRFGQIGSMPVRGFFPWAAVEDEKYHVMLGAQLYHNGSWQMELYGRDERAALSGGLADRELGHWMKTLEPGERFLSPRAVLSTCIGGVDDIAWRLTEAQKEGIRQIPAERELPVVFNEFCTTWGNPTEENLLRIVDAIREKGFTYCVIDAGWYAIGNGDWNNDMGDWNISQERFPGGFGKTVEAIRAAGMIPGLWFEPECVGKAAEVFFREDWQLKRDGVPIQTGARRFWDMRKREVKDYLTDKIAGILQKYGFGYLKMDYNDNIGIGCEGAESLGEGLRQSVEASRKFAETLRQKMPELVIENCSSGGHRLEPSMQAVSSMSSFSDAHECITIPIIAANVQRAVLPEQSQIWAVLRKTDDEKRLYYSMISAMLGRMCISGDVCDLDREQWRIVEEGMAFYKKAVPIIRNGKSRRLGCEEISYTHPVGWQAVIREGTEDAAGQMLIVVHRFYQSGDKREEPCREGGDAGSEISIPVKSGCREIADRYGRSGIELKMVRKEEENILYVSGMGELDAVAVRLEVRRGKTNCNFPVNQLY